MPVWKLIYFSIASTLLIQLASVPVAHAQAPLQRLREVFEIPSERPLAPRTEKDDAIETLAREIDWLEDRIDRWGTVVAKTPDVWGQARLMQHRREYEEILSAELYAFEKDRINAAQFVSDQAFLATVLAINGASPDASGSPGSLALSVTGGGPGSTGGDAGFNINTPDLQATATFGDAGAFLGGAFGDGKPGLSGLNLEQTQQLDQLSRYIHHLHELRRINEGDDTADAPGYSLHLVRIPVSIIPGTKSKAGHGAEVTITATPFLGPELLPVTFRDWVINDLTDQMSLALLDSLNRLRKLDRKIHEANQFLDSLPLTFLLGPRDIVDPVLKGYKFHYFERVATPDVDNVILRVKPDRLTIDVASIERALEDYQAFNQVAQTVRVMIKALELAKEKNSNKPRLTNFDRAQLANQFSQYSTAQLALEKADRVLKESTGADVTLRLESLQAASDGVAAVSNTDDSTPAGIRITDLANAAGIAKQLSTYSTAKFGTSSAAQRRSRFPIPSSHFESVIGQNELALLSRITYSLTSGHERANMDEPIHLSNVRSFLREEVSAAYDLLGSESLQTLWTDFVVHTNLYEQIRTNSPELARTRQFFYEQLSQSGVPHSSVTAVLAWAVMVDSVLINERLNEDVRETAGTRSRYLPANGWMPFYGPFPPDEARMAFNEHVNLRWPIRVFALDPVVTEQNIADYSSLYREMQIAVALSYAAGNIGFSGATQAMRKLQRDRATIDLNRTVVGFGHGEDTFGWRFYPRFQTPPVEGNLTVLFRDLVLGGPTDKTLERKAELEPGMRECIALVVMPSFVPWASFETRTNWFRLDAPGRSAISMADTMQYSRSIQAMRTGAHQCIQCAHLYREGEVDRLLNRVQQLDRELPLQTMYAQFPTENTHGGYELLSSGTTELAPELYAWYGAPGVDPQRSTTVYLEGDSFSVHGTRLIIGNRALPFELISRQLIQVTIPAGVAVIESDEFGDNESFMGHVDAHVATPYGVSQHLSIPVLRRPRQPQLTEPIVHALPMHLEFSYEKGNAAQTLKLLNRMNFGEVLKVAIPRGVNLDQSKATVRVELYSGEERLFDAKVDDVPLAVDRTGFSVSGIYAQQLFGRSGPETEADTINHALADYFKFLVTNRLVGSSANFEIRGRVVLQYSNGSVPALGDLRMTVRLTEKPGVE